MHSLNPVTTATLYMASLSKHWGVLGKRPMPIDYRDLLLIECLPKDIYMRQYIQFYGSDKTKFMKSGLDASLLVPPDRSCVVFSCGCSQPVRSDLGE